MIPKIIHLCWLSGDEYPPLIQQCINSIYEKLPDYEIKIWTKENFDINSVQWVKEAFEAKKYAFAADYIRFWSIYNYGGIYLDSDVEVLNSFNNFLDCKSFIGFEYLNIPEAAVVGAEKGCEWIKKCMDYYNGKSFYTDNGEMKKDVVPNLVKLVLEKIYKIKVFDNGKIKKINNIMFYPYYYFSPKNYWSDKVLVKSQTVCVHRFASAWGPNPKRKIMMRFHSIFIKIFGKKIHDYLYRLVRPYSKTFNDEFI